MKYYVINASAKGTGITESTLRRWESMRFFTADCVFWGENEMRMYSDQPVDLIRRAKNVIDSSIRVRAAFEFLSGSGRQVGIETAGRFGLPF